MRRRIQRTRRGLPLEFVDPQANEHYVLIWAELYERLKGVFDDSPLTEQERLELLQQFGKRAGWDDPELDVYEEYREKP